MGLFGDVIVPGVGLVGAGIGGTITIYIYYRNSKLQRAQWLYSLFEKFFYESRYAEIRRMLDYSNEGEIRRICQTRGGGGESQQEEKLVDYLNFFEFIASLWLLRQLPLREIGMMFDYYICRLGDSDFIMQYVKEQGFEGVSALVAKVRSLRDSQ